ncbi:MAG: HDOD domain-containing protein [Leptospira sp.]|nr:HDOD domain-containing protein [Leptospira sp.]
MAETKSVPIQWNQELGIYTNINGFNDSIVENQPIHFRFSNFDDHAKIAITQTLDRYLIFTDLIFLRDAVLSTIKESITNAVKANAKRLYFQKQQADIMDQSSYIVVIKDFKQGYLSQKDQIDKELVTSKYSVIVTFIHNKDLLRIRIMNNIKITQDELSRIQEKINKGNQYNDLGEAFLEMGDELEGAGLGLIMAMMMLKNEGLQPNSFRYESGDDKTSVIIDIPTKTRDSNPQFQKADNLLKEVDNLPAFPKIIQDIQETINKPNSSINQIAEMIKRDVSLSAGILKLSNSAAYRRGDKVETLDRALQLIGLKELQTLLYSLGTKKIMEDKFPAFASIWEKSNESAFYCKLLAKKMGYTKETTANLMSSALLHDIGEIVLLSLEKDKMDSIQEVSQSKEFSSNLTLEEISFGITHTKLGAMIAEKWFFPELFSKAMESHHTPLTVAELYKEIGYPIYLSDMMIRINYQESHPSEIPKSILEYCKFNSLSEFQSFRTNALDEFRNSN